MTYRGQHSSQRRKSKNLQSAWRPFRHRLYSLFWIAAVVANIGWWMSSAAASWLMTSLNPHPLMVSLVQVAASLPMFLFALPAGALADIVDKRRFLLSLEITLTGGAAVFAALLSADMVGPAALLAFVFFVTTCFALEAPAWQSVVPQLVPREDLPNAIAANSLGVNLSRAVGPALSGVLIATVSIAAPFWMVVFSNVGIVAFFLWWRPRGKHASTLPTERFISAIRAGFRYAAYNRPLRATLARSVGFFFFASAYWALLPLVTRVQLSGGPELYGLLLGTIGAAAVACALMLPWLKSKFGADGLVVLGELGTAAALVLIGIARDPAIAVVGCLLAGMSWIAAIASLNTSAQLSLPDWVRGRGLAMYVTVFFGSMAAGSMLWGETASFLDLAPTHFIAAAGAVLAIPVTSRWKLQSDDLLDLTPSMHWPEPILASAVENDAGPVLILVEYRVKRTNRKAFLKALGAIARQRRRDGAYDWGIFEDTAEPGRFIESFLVESWIEHLRQHQRVTKADQVLEKKVRRLLHKAPVVTHFVGAKA